MSESETDPQPQEDNMESNGKGSQSASESEGGESSDSVGTYSKKLAGKIHRSFIKKQWKEAAMRVRRMPDPWGEQGFEDFPEETVTRHMYYPKSRAWKTDKIIVKIQPTPFAHGAMRECFRMKKLSTFSQNPNWKNASNYVAKRYMKPVDLDTYFEDVKLQMDSKLWGDRYSKLNVPKKVDFCQTYVIEFDQREGSPLYGVEHFIDGGYIKYNSNSGFVSEVNRMTPQAFSHFTFEKSNHQLIVVDIQGVGDLYTDPQMHTVDMEDYKEANLGTRGMALFFSSHICNSICEMLGLTQFNLSEEEMERLETKRWNFSTSTTRISDLSLPESAEASVTRSDVFGSDCEGDKKKRTGAGKDLYLSLSNAEGVRQKLWLLGNMSSGVPSNNYRESPLPSETPSPLGSGIVLPALENGGPKGNRLELPPVHEAAGISASVDKVIREKGEEGEEEEKDLKKKESLKVLGMIHFNLAEYHEIGRFSLDHLTDVKCCLYHLSKSAQCGNVGAIYMLARIYLQRSHEKFLDVKVKASSAHECEGMDYLVQAAEKGLRVAMLEAAKALDMGEGLGQALREGDKSEKKFTAKRRSRNWQEAVDWYAKVFTAPDQDTLPCLDPDYLQMPEPDYSILARMAEMYRTGGHGLTKDPQKSGELYNEAAEAALNGMKGKLSTKYYMLAEEVWGEVEGD